MSDADRRIIWCSALTCGSTHDSAALAYSRLGEILSDKDHPINSTDYWMAGDDAYSGNAKISDSLLTPIPGSDLGIVEDCYNYWQSRLRIEVECCFGALVARFGILQRPLQVSMEHATLLLSTLSKLHNVCMEQGLPRHAGRVMSDEYGDTATAGDMFGASWVEWNIPSRHFEKVDRDAFRHGRTRVLQRLPRRARRGHPRQRHARRVPRGAPGLGAQPPRPARALINRLLCVSLCSGLQNGSAGRSVGVRARVERAPSRPRARAPPPSAAPCLGAAAPTSGPSPAHHCRSGAAPLAALGAPEG